MQPWQILHHALAWQISSPQVATIPSMFNDPAAPGRAAHTLPVAGIWCGTGVAATVGLDRCCRLWSLATGARRSCCPCTGAAGARM